MSQLATYLPILPEIVVTLGALALLMLGAFEKENDWTAETVGWLAVAVLAVAVFVIAGQGEEASELFEGAFRNEAYARFVKILVLGGTAGALIMSFAGLKRLGAMKFEMPVLMLISAVGMMMMVSAGDLIAVYLGIELMSLSLYVMAAFRRDDLRSSEAGLKYFVLGALSSGMLLYGASLVYGFTGATSFSAIAKAAVGVGADGPGIGLLVGLVFLLVGLAFKISAVPFHMWTPDVYEGAPTPVTAYFAAVPKLAAAALLVRVLAEAFPGAVGEWRQIIVFLSIASMLLGAFAAIGQTSIKRLLAYSSIGNIGFALVGLAAGTEAGYASVLVYLALYVVMTLGAFACVLSMRREGGYVESIDDLAGLARTDLGIAFALATIMFSMAGIPPLAGFFGKFYVFLAAVEAGLYPLAIIGVLASVVAAYYYIRIVKVMFVDAPMPAFQPSDRGVRLVMTATTAIVLLFWIHPSLLVDASAAAARTLGH